MGRWGRDVACVVCIAWLSEAPGAAAGGSAALGAAGEGGAVPGSSSMCPATGEVPDLPAPEFLHVRPVDESIAAPFRAGIRRSRTLAELVNHLETLDGRVYLLAGAYRRPSRGLVLRGGTSHEVGVTSSFRIVKVTVDPMMGDQTIATIGHELRHATEILDAPDTVDVRSVERLYERIGFLVGAGVYETNAARRTEHQVFEDLKHCRF